MSSEKKNDGDGLVPEGRYKVKCTDHAFGRAGTGTEQIGIQLSIVDGPHAGQVLTYYGYFTDATSEDTVKAMRALGWKGVDIAHMETMYEGEGIAVVKHEPDQEGKYMRARVRWINPSGVAMNEKLEGADLARFGQKLKAVAAKVSTDKPGPSKLPPSGNTRDDVPPPDDRDMPWNRR